MIGCGRFSDKVLKKIWETGSRNIRSAFARGVHMALGSDAGAYRVYHGQGLADEWNCFKEILGDSQPVQQRLLEGEQRIREIPETVRINRYHDGRETSGGLRMDRKSLC